MSDRIKYNAGEMCWSDTGHGEEYKEAIKKNGEESREEFCSEYVERSDSYSVCYLNEDYVGIAADWYECWNGAIHGMYGSDYYMFDRHTGNRVSITDVTYDSPEEICEIIAPYVEAAAEGEIDDEGWEAMVLEENRFFLSEEGIGIHFDVYEISSYASGDTDVIVPYGMFGLRR